MDLKNIHGKLKVLRDRIKNQGAISPADEKELKSLIRQTLETANGELEDIHDRLHHIAASSANDNKDLNEDQQARLELIEKTGTGSLAVH